MSRRGSVVASLPPAIAAQARARYAQATSPVYGAHMQPQGRSKYGAKAIVVDGIRFSSRLEARVYEQLAAAKAAGTLTYFLRQVPLHLPGGVRYVVDFVAFRVYGENVAQVRYFEAKGADLPLGKAKRKIAEACYGITIEIITKANIHAVAEWVDGQRSQPQEIQGGSRD